MNLSRREFMQLLAAASAAGFALPGCEKEQPPAPAATSGQTPATGPKPTDPYELPPFGNVSLLHFTDCHAQLQPIYFREPNINIGVGASWGKAPHLVGDAFLKHFGIQPGTMDAHAFTYLDYVEAARKFGKVGGFAHLRTLVKRLRDQRPNSLLLDGGDTWQGSATALWTRGKDMVGACNRLGVDIMTGHWEFTYYEEETLANIKEFGGEFVAQNVFVKDEAAFDYRFADFPGYNENTQRAFQPYTIKEMAGVPVAVIGQAFPYTPIANPGYHIPDWTFGIRDVELQKMVDEVRSKGAQVVVVLSHNGMDVDLKMASRVTGIDAILGGHTHDGVPAPVPVENPGGKTLVINSGSNGKFLSVLDLDVKDGKVRDYRFKMLPVFSNLLEPDAEMTTYINQVRAPYKDKLDEQLAVTDTLLYRRGNFNGTFDQLIVDAMLEVRGADIAFSPGFRWGVSLLPGDPITMDALMTQTAITYPKSTLTEMSGDTIKTILEDIADNLFHADPYLQQGGDMVRIGGLKYTIDPTQKIGSRISNMELRGEPVDAGKTFLVAGWASVQEHPDDLPDIWDVVAEYLRDKKTVEIKELNTPKIRGVDGNPGIADV
jgi:sulfur-oxidizing protein SoxB